MWNAKMVESANQYIVDANVHILDRLVFVQDFGNFKIVLAYNDRTKDMVGFAWHNFIVCDNHIINIAIWNGFEAIHKYVAMGNWYFR